MKKILEYFLWVFCWLNTPVCWADSKFEILPDLPDPLAAYAQSAAASTVSGSADTSSMLGGTQAIGHEPSIISVIFSLAIVILLIYVTGIIYTKLNKTGINALKKHGGDYLKSQVSVVSTTALGNNKTLHVVELEGKRMLIGASSGAIQLIKDLGSVSKEDMEEDYSHIEIPTIKIPKIEIPKIEIPTIGFSKLMTKIHKDFESNSNQSEENNEAGLEPEVEESQENIIDSLFNKEERIQSDEESEENTNVNMHKVDPDDFALYKKYLS